MGESDLPAGREPGGHVPQRHPAGRGTVPPVRADRGDAVAGPGHPAGLRPAERVSNCEFQFQKREGETEGRALIKSVKY